MDVISLRHILVCCFSRTHLTCVVNESHGTPDNERVGLVWKLFHNLVESGASTSIQCGRWLCFHTTSNSWFITTSEWVGVWYIGWKLQKCERKNLQIMWRHPEAYLSQLHCTSQISYCWKTKLWCSLGFLSFSWIGWCCWFSWVLPFHIHANAINRL